MSDNTVNPGFFRLPHLGVMTIRGQDTVKFLQGQSTQDFNSLTDDEFRFGAFCTPKGRIYLNFVALHGESTDTIHLIAHQSAIENALTTLKKYAVFYQIEMIHDQSRVVMGAMQSTGSALVRNDRGISFHWPEDRTLTLTTTSASTDISNPEPLAEQWQVQDIRQGLAWITAEMISECIPQHINLQAIEGINFKKGCYTGQEIVARMQYKGQLKSWCLPAKLTDHPVLPGTLVVDHDGHKIGQVVNSCATDALVLVNVDKKSEAQTKENVPQTLTFSTLPYTV